MEYDVTLQTVAWFNERRIAGHLEISPKFQRRAVWLDAERAALLATIMQKLPFPEVYVQVVTDLESGKQRYVVVDGQQRITSILRFIDNEVSLPIDRDHGLLGQYMRDLDDSDRTIFWNYKIVVRMLGAASDSEIRDLFGRLNTNNYALNDQELRNAKYTGKFKQSAERLADEPFFQRIELFTAREVRRMEDIEFVSELLLRCVVGITNKKDLLDDVYSANNEDFPEQATRELEFQSSIALIRQITTPENAALVKTKSTFFSLFGACVKYYRDTGRTSFRAPDRVSEKVTEFLEAAKIARDPAVVSTPHGQYFDAVSRAASDRSRRAKRETLLTDVIASADTV